MSPQVQGRARRVCPRPRDGGPPSSRNAADCRVYDARWMSHLCAGRRVTPERRVHWSRENEAQSPARPVWRPSGFPKPCAPGFSRAGRGPGDGTRVRGPRRGRGSPVAAAGAACAAWLAGCRRPGPGFFFSSRGGDSPLQRHQPQRTLSRRLTGPLIVCTRRSGHGRFGTSGWTAVPGLVAADQRPAGAFSRLLCVSSRVPRRAGPSRRSEGAHARCPWSSDAAAGPRVPSSCVVRLLKCCKQRTSFVTECWRRVTTVRLIS